jgi:death-on-curing protein
VNVVAAPHPGRSADGVHWNAFSTKNFLISRKRWSASANDLSQATRAAIDGSVVVRDLGLLESALARPRATVFGRDAYATLDLKAAALLHSLATNHPLVDGNKRLALAGTIAFYGMNGRRLPLSNDEAYELVMRVAKGELDDVADIAVALRTQPRA